MTHGRANNFDFLRLLAAALVIVAHAFPLTGTPEAGVSGLFRTPDLGIAGVAIFFSISGFLVMQSWMRDPVPYRYAWRRVLRIFPALIVLVLASMFLLGPLVTALTLAQYFREQGFYDYLNVLLLFSMPYALPGAFVANPYAQVINGSLWSLPIEAGMYILLPILASLNSRLRESALYWSGITLLFIVASWVLTRPMGIFGMSAPLIYEFGAYFFGGVTLAVLRKRGFEPGLAIAGVLLLLILASANQLWARPLIQACLPFILVAIGTRRAPVLASAGRFGDFSYGIYIYAFPVQQTITWLGFTAGHLALNIACVIAITTALAALSWHFVEEPALRHKPVG
jgi:peptidoglycan/LPS O-acetylase OafA/YrhL